MPGNQGLTLSLVAPCHVQNSDRKFKYGGGGASDIKDGGCWQRAEGGAKAEMPEREMEKWISVQ